MFDDLATAGFGAADHTLGDKLREKIRAFKFGIDDSSKLFLGCFEQIGRPPAQSPRCLRAGRSH